MTKNLKTRLLQADVVCKECGEKYGKYSVGCSSTWMGTCDVCGEEKGITEVRDWGYLTKGINELNAQRPAQPFSELTKDFTPERKARIKEQSAKVANYMLTQEPIMTDEDLDQTLTPITLELTEDEVLCLYECLDQIQDLAPEDIAIFESIEKKITDLYQDHCLKYNLSSAMVEYNKKYGTWGTGEDAGRWEKFRDNYEMLLELGFIT
jgi:hypothetical protein